MSEGAAKTIGCGFAAPTMVRLLAPPPTLSAAPNGGHKSISKHHASWHKRQLAQLAPYITRNSLAGPQLALVVGPQNGQQEQLKVAFDSNIALSAGGNTATLQHCNG